MYHNKLVLGPVLVGLVSMAISLTVGCAAKKAATEGPEADFDFRYQLAEGDVLKYRIKSSFVQTVKVGGRAMEVTASETRDFSMKSLGDPDGNLNLLLTMDAMDIKITGPQGDIATDMSEVIGKSFKMMLSVLGEELEISGANAIQYDIGPQGKRSIESQFSAFFPDLPGGTIGMNDSWKTEAIVTEEGINGDLTVSITSNNTLVGFERIHGLECAKIAAPFTGTLKGRGEEQGVELITDGKITGTGTWYFAYREGIYVSETSAGIAEGTVTAMTPEKMEIPLKRDFNIEVTLLE